MPRVTIKRKEYKVSDLTKHIRAVMHEYGISQEELGYILNTSQQGISYKLKTGSFNYKELLSMFDYLKLSDEEILKIMKLKEAV